MNIVSCHSPKWASAEHTNIVVYITVSGLGEIPFGASKADPEPHGVDLYNRCIAGEFGEIAEYTPITFSEEQQASASRTYRDSLIAATDWTQLPDVPVALSTKWAVYRQALRDITAQPGFPATIIWPEKPL